MKRFDDKREEELQNSKLRVFTNPTEEMVKLFSDKSYAIIRNPDGAFVPLIPRHMSKENWRHLFWHDPKILVINGKRFRDICSVCRHSLACIGRGKNHSYNFDCKATPETFIVPLTIRKKGEPACPR
jgi:hypothetical protein